MPLSTLDGEPSEEVHEHYDPDGNLTGTTVVTRPGWSEEDRAWALALTLRESAQCSRGHDLTESLDDAWKWLPLPPAVCNACVALDSAVEAHKNDPRHRAMLHSLQKVPRPPKPKRKGR